MNSESIELNILTGNRKAFCCVDSCVVVVSKLVGTKLCYFSDVINVLFHNCSSFNTLKIVYLRESYN